jgi:hypothetical protein
MTLLYQRLRASPPRPAGRPARLAHRWVAPVILAWSLLAASTSCLGADVAAVSKELEATFDQFIADTQAFAEARANEHYLKVVIEQSAKDEIRDRYVRSCEALAKAFDAISEVTQDKQAINESFEKARAIATAYRKGDGSQADAIRAFREVAASYPGTVEADEALFYAAAMYVQGLRDGDKPDRVAAAVLLKQLIARDGVPNRWTMLAEEELASYPDETEERLRQRSEFLSRMAERRKPEWLKATYLYQGNVVEVTGRERVKMISASLTNIIESTARTSYNAVHDASKARDPGEQLGALQTRHQAIPFVDDAIKRKLADEDVPLPVAAKERNRFGLVAINVVFVGIVVLAIVVNRRSKSQTKNVASSATHQKSS